MYFVYIMDKKAKKAKKSVSFSNKNTVYYSKIPKEMRKTQSQTRKERKDAVAILKNNYTQPYWQKPSDLWGDTNVSGTEIITMMNKNKKEWGGKTRKMKKMKKRQKKTKTRRV